MKVKLLLFLFIIFQLPCYSIDNEWDKIETIMKTQAPKENTSVDGLGRFISSRFTGEEDNYRAAFYWVTHQVSYDVQNMTNTRLYNSAEDAVNRTLSERKAICQGYTELLHAICDKLGLKSYVVSGFTKQYGKFDPLPHAWIAVEINNIWYISDPTWGAGYIKDQQFTPNFNPDWFLVTPEKGILSHMPFDPLFQLMKVPVPFEQFADEGNPPKRYGNDFAFRDSLALYDKQDQPSRLLSSIRRIENNGKKNSLVDTRLEDLKQELFVYEQNAMILRFNEAVKLSNQGVSVFNVYVQYKNRQFQGTVTAEKLRQLNDSSTLLLQQSAALIAGNESKDPAFMENNSKLSLNITRNLARCSEESSFLNKYLATPVNQRKSLFITKGKGNATPKKH
ncbi:MAG: hypothetical protein NTU44_05310 [Bacteroidetes bacterium]|nr:hypothetical protein [Bacteroidota bacterium]